MQIIKRQVKDKPLTVIIEYPEYNSTVVGLVRKINSFEIQFSARDDERHMKIGLMDVYRLDSSMSETEEMASGTDLVRISQTCIMNIDHLKEIRQVKNSHLEAVLDNDEMLIVSRKYLKDIKKVFQRR